MTLLSGGVSSTAVYGAPQVSGIGAYDYGYNPSYALPTTGVFLNSSPALLSSYASDYGSSSYYTPQTAYSMPVSYNSATANNAYDYSSVNYSPVSVNNSAMNVTAPTFNPVGPSGIADQSGPIQIGGRTYAPNQLLAQADLTYAPGGFAAGRPQYDTLSDSQQGYDYTGRPDMQTLSANAGTNEQPPTLSAPDIAQQQGIPNIFRQAPQAQDYYNSPANQQVLQTPDMVMNNAPNRADYYPPAQSMARPQGLLQRAIWAMPNQARNRAAGLAAAEQRFQHDDNQYTQRVSTIMPGVVATQREIIAQQAANDRINQQTFNQGALSAFNAGLDRQAAQMMNIKDSMAMMADAYQLPSYINGEPNRQKLGMINTAGRQMGWSKRDIDAVAEQQDFNAAQAMKLKSMQVESAAFALKANQQKLSKELNLLTAQAAHDFAQARLMGAQAGAINFDNNQNQKIAYALRLGKLADIAKAIGAQEEERATRGDRVGAANLRNRQALASIYKTQMEAMNIPAETAAKLSTAMAALGASLDPNIRASGNGLADSIFGALSIPQKPMVVTSPDGSTTISNAPVDTTDLTRKIQEQLQLIRMQNQPQGMRPSYRQSQPQMNLPPSYFTGQPLSGQAAPANYQPAGEPILYPAVGGPTDVELFNTPWGKNTVKNEADLSKPVKRPQADLQVGPFPLMNTIDGGPTGYGGQPGADDPMFQPSNKEIQSQISNAVHSGKQINPNTELGKYDRAMSFVLGAVMRGTRPDLEQGRAYGRHHEQYDTSREVSGTIMDNIMQADAQVQAETGKSLTELYSQFGLSTIRNLGVDGFTQELQRNSPRLVVPDLVRFKPSSGNRLSANASSMELSPFDMTSAGAMYMQEMNATSKNIARINQWASSRSNNAYKGYREMAEALNNQKAVAIYDKWATRPAEAQVSGQIVEPDIIFDKLPPELSAKPRRY